MLEPSGPNFAPHPTFLGAVFTFSGVVFAAFIDSAFFGVTPSLRSLFGMLIIVAAAAACLGLIAKAEKNGKFVPTLRSQPSD